MTRYGYPAAAITATATAATGARNRKFEYAEGHAVHPFLRSIARLSMRRKPGQVLVCVGAKGGI